MFGQLVAHCPEGGDAVAVFRDYDQDQNVFRAIHPLELLEEDHRARVIDRVVELMDLGELYAQYADEGNPAYHPRMMLKVLFYSYYSGLMSCREMWAGLKNRADYIYLSGDQIPDFRTLNAFRSRHLELLPKLFAQIVLLCVQVGMVDFEHLAIDGQKIQANACYRRSKTRSRVKKNYERVLKGIKELLEKEPNREFTAEKKKGRLERLRKQKRQLLGLKKMLDGLEEEQANVNMTDPEAPVMSHKDGRKLPSYNHQSATDGSYGVVCAVATRDRGDSPAELFEMVDQAKENTGQGHEAVLADPAFCDYERLEKAEEEREEEYFLPDGRMRSESTEDGNDGRYTRERFRKTKSGKVICPQGGEMMLKGVQQHEDGHTVSVYEGTGCPECPVRERCTKGKRRTLSIDSREGYRDRMRTKLRSERGRERYMKRQGIAEPLHGDDQKNRGWRQHHLRGLQKAQGEFLLIRIATNLGKIVRYRAAEVLALSP
jgi:transposase